MVKAKKPSGQAALNLAPPVAPIETWDDADLVGKDYALLTFDIEAAESEMNALINGIQERLLPKISAMKAEHAMKERRLLSFAKAHRKDFGGKKSRKLNYITLLFRKVGEKVVLTEELLVVIANLKKAGLDRGVVKTTESIDKTALRTVVPEEKRERIGFEVIPTGDEPKVEVDRKKVESFREGAASAKSAAS